MPRTIIIDTEVVGTKRGARIETNPIFTKRRYDVHDGKLNYLYSETRTHATVFQDRVPVDLVLVHLDEKRNVAFDVRSLPPGSETPSSCSSTASAARPSTTCTTRASRSSSTRGTSPSRHRPSPRP